MKPKQKRKHLTPEEAARLKGEACAHSTRTCLMVRLMLEAGLRGGEVSTLRTKDLVNIEQERLQGGAIVYKLRVKGKWRQRYNEYIYLSQRFYDTLSLFSSKRRIFVFEGRNGKAISTRQIRNIVKKALQLAGLGEHSAHHLRHSYARFIYQATGNLSALKKQLRHKSLSLTAYYAGLHLDLSGDADARDLIMLQ